MEIKEVVRAFVATDIMKGEDASLFDDSLDLINSGILDSLAMMQLVTFLERDFAITVATEEITPENFGSVERLANYVRQKMSPRPTSG